MLPPPAAVAATNLLAALPGLGEGYGGKSAFWENASSSASGDLTQIGFLAVIFPVALTAFLYKPEPDPYNEDELPPGWRKVPSQSRPGQFSFEQTSTKERYDRLPPQARKGLM